MLFFLDNIWYNKYVIGNVGFIMQREIMVKELEINEVSEMLEKSEEQYKNGKTYKARTVFEELRKKYNY